MADLELVPSGHEHTVILNSSTPAFQRFMTDRRPVVDITILTFLVHFATIGALGQLLLWLYHRTKLQAGQGCWLGRVADWVGLQAGQCCWLGRVAGWAGLLGGQGWYSRSWLYAQGQLHSVRAPAGWFSVTHGCKTEWNELVLGGCGSVNLSHLFTRHPAEIWLLLMRRKRWLFHN